MEIRNINVNGKDITCYEDGSIEKANKRSGKLVRGFGYDHKGYKIITINKKTFRLHRLIAWAFLPDWNEALTVDHINGDKTDNRPSNLRMATMQQQHQAYQAKPVGCSSEYRGVCRHRNAGKWQANIRVNGKQKNLGIFTCETEAARARDKAAIKYGYLKESLNFPTK